MKELEEIRSMVIPYETVRDRGYPKAYEKYDRQIPAILRIEAQRGNTYRDFTDFLCGKLLVEGLSLNVLGNYLGVKRLTLRKLLVRMNIPLDAEKKVCMNKW